MIDKLTPEQIRQRDIDENLARAKALVAECELGIAQAVLELQTRDYTVDLFNRMAELRQKADRFRRGLNFALYALEHLSGLKK